LGKEVGRVLEEEEAKFRRTINLGIKVLEKEISQLQGKNFSGEAAFNLYQTYGFPVEMTEEMLKEKNILLNKNEFEKEYHRHQDQSRTASAGMFKGGLADAGKETTRLHSAAHLMLAALRRVLGEHVLQKGSNITAERLRLDFSHKEKVTPEELKKVEDLVNEQIKKDLPVVCEEMSPDEAKKSGAMGVFDERYGSKVKVYSIAPFSREICGGPHVKSTGELGYFKIIKEESSSGGTRRIKAVLK